MTTQQAVDIFNIIQDTYGSPYITPDEAVMYLNLATDEWLNRLVPDSQGGVVNFEFDSNTASQVKPLIYGLTLTPTSSTVKDENINLALQTAAEDDCAEYFRLLSVGVVSGGIARPAKYVPHNQFLVLNNNTYKKGTSAKPLYTLHNDSLKFNFSLAGTPLELVVMRKPKKMALNPNPVNPDFDNYTMYTIIMIALKMAGVATRDDELIASIRNTALQGSN